MYILFYFFYDIISFSWHFQWTANCNLFWSGLMVNVPLLGHQLLFSPINTWMRNNVTGHCWNWYERILNYWYRNFVPKVFKKRTSKRLCSFHSGNLISIRTIFESFHSYVGVSCRWINSKIITYESTGIHCTFTINIPIKIGLDDARP